MKLKNTLSLGLLSGLLLLSLFQACSNQKQVLNENLPIKEPFENITIGCNGNTIDNEKGGEIFYASGTKLYIPPNTFVDASGDPIKGEVTINYREFHSPSEVLVSGIPMKFEQGGEMGDFETAGMFEITAEAAGNEVFVGEGGNIDIWMASDDEDPNFQFYRFDTKANEWEMLDAEPQTVEPNAFKQQVQEAIDNPIKIVQSFNETKPVINLSQRKGFGQVSKVEVDEPINLWQTVDGSTPLQDEIAANAKAWSSYEMKSNNDGTYDLRVEYKKSHYVLTVAPVLFGEDLRAAKGADARTSYADDPLLDSLIQDFADNNKISLIPSYTRKLSLPNTGTFNCDRVMDRLASVIIDNVTYKLPDGSELNSSETTVYIYQISESGADLIYQYGGIMRFDKSKENIIFAILPGDRLAYITNDQLETDYDLRKMKRKREGEFKFNILSDPIESIDELDQVLAQL